MFEYKLGLQIQSTNTKEARERDKKEIENKILGRGGVAAAQNPPLPDPRHSQNFQRVLGQHQEQAPLLQVPAKQLSGQSGLTRKQPLF